VQENVPLKSSAPVGAADDITAGNHLYSPDEITGFPVFPAGTKSLLSKFLTKDMYNELCEKKDPYGFTF